MYNSVLFYYTLKFYNALESRLVIAYKQHSHFSTQPDTFL